MTGDYAIPAYEAMDDSDVETLLAAHEGQQATKLMMTAEAQFRAL